MTTTNLTAFRTATTHVTQTDITITRGSAEAERVSMIDEILRLSRDCDRFGDKIRQLIFADGQATGTHQTIHTVLECSSRDDVLAALRKVGVFLTTPAMRQAQELLAECPAVLDRKCGRVETGYQTTADITVRELAGMIGRGGRDNTNSCFLTSATHHPRTGKALCPADLIDALLAECRFWN